MTELQKVSLGLVEALKDLPNVKGAITLYLKTPNAFYGEWELYMKSSTSLLQNITKEFKPKGVPSSIELTDKDLRGLGGQLHMLWFHKTNVTYVSPFMKIESEINEDGTYAAPEVTELKKVPDEVKGLLKKF